MDVKTSIRLFELVQEFIPDKLKAKEFVTKLEEAVDGKFNAHKETIASKTDVAQLESKLSKTIYIVGLIQFLAIVGSVLAIVNFMLK